MCVRVCVCVSGCIFSAIEAPVQRNERLKAVSPTRSSLGRFGAGRRTLALARCGGVWIGTHGPSAGWPRAAKQSKKEESRACLRSNPTALERSRLFWSVCVCVVLKGWAGAKGFAYRGFEGRERKTLPTIGQQCWLTLVE